MSEAAPEGGRGIGAHQSARMISDSWLTPPEITEALGPFDLDPCAAPEPRPWSTAGRHIAWPENGLTAVWPADVRVWLNPPYSRDAAAWMRRLAAHGRGTALVFARTETSWFAETVWQRASAALFLYGRIHFHLPSGRRARFNAGAPSVLAAYGSYDTERLRDCGLPGTFVQWQAKAPGESLQGSLFGEQAG